MSRARRAEWTQRRLNLGNDYWLFLVGVNNSGTTLLSKVLSQHPRTRSLPIEGHFLTAAFPTPRDHGYPRLWSLRPDMFRMTEQSDPQAALRAKFDWSHQFSSDKGILLEKSPPNSLRTRWLQQHFQPCKFIAIVRSPYAVCEGMRRRKQYDLATAATHWARANSFLWDDLPHLTHCHVIRYEQFCENAEVHLDQIREFMGLDEPFRANSTRTLDVHNVHNKPLPIANLNNESLKRLSPSDIETINQVAGDVMRRIGYQLIRRGNSKSALRAA